MTPEEKQFDVWWEVARCSVPRKYMAMGLAFEAGRKAGLEAAAQICEKVGFDIHAGRDDGEAYDCADAIRDSMEGDA